MAEHLRQQPGADFFFRILDGGAAVAEIEQPVRTVATTRMDPHGDIPLAANLLDLSNEFVAVHGLQSRKKISPCKEKEDKFVIFVCGVIGNDEAATLVAGA